MFKVGDKVKHKDLKWKHGVGRVIKIDRHYILVKYDTTACVVCTEKDCSMPIDRLWRRADSMENAVRKNEQLLFSFMK